MEAFHDGRAIDAGVYECQLADGVVIVVEVDDDGRTWHDGLQISTDRIQRYRRLGTGE